MYEPGKHEYLHGSSSKLARRWLGIRVIREEVFIHEQHVPVELEWDELDANCIHILAMDSAGNPVGTARLLLNGVSVAWRC